MEKKLTVVENNTNKNDILDEVKALLNKKDAEEKQMGRKKEILLLIQEENKNTIVSNTPEAVAVTPNNWVQLILL